MVLEICSSIVLYILLQICFRTFPIRTFINNLQRKKTNKIIGMNVAWNYRYSGEAFCKVLRYGERWILLPSLDHIMVRTTDFLATTGHSVLSASNENQRELQWNSVYKCLSTEKLIGHIYTNKDWTH